MMSFNPDGVASRLKDAEDKIGISGSKGFQLFGKSFIHYSLNLLRNKPFFSSNRKYPNPSLLPEPRACKMAPRKPFESPHFAHHPSVFDNPTLVLVPSLVLPIEFSCVLALFVDHKNAMFLTASNLEALGELW